MSIFFNKNGLSNNGGGNNIPDASVTQKGIVQLSNAIDSQSQTLAATSKAVNDAITEANNYTDTVLSNLTTLEWEDF